ncbi:MAG: hypothetical protein ACRD9L_00335, partial [Bryobacteraceae bacterium]
MTIKTGGALPNEVSRYGLALTWSVTGIVPGGVIKRTNHKIYSIFEDPLDPAVSNESGTALSPITGPTKQRLDQLTRAIGGANRRFPTPTPADIDHLIWLLHVQVNDSSPPYFDGRRAVSIRYGKSGPSVELIDQWVMWLASHAWTRPDEYPHWNYGACISYAQLMKTMLAAAGINSRRAWVIPKTTLLPDGSTVSLSDSDLLALDDRDPDLGQQTHDFTEGGLTFHAAVKLIDKPTVEFPIRWENFEACLYYGGKLVPGAIPTRRYPAAVLHATVGFASATEVLRWWHSVNHGSFHRFMAWVSKSPQGFFDRNGKFYDSPYDIP